MERIAVLLVDDEPILFNVTRIHLEMAGDITVDVSSSAKEAIEKIHAREYDVIVSDYEMPVMNGIELLKLLRNEGNDTPFIIFTGRGREDVIIEALNSGADFYLKKGSEPRTAFSTLGGMIREAVRRRESRGGSGPGIALYKRIIEQTSDLVWLTDLSGRCTFGNHAFRTFFGSRETPAGECAGPLFASPESASVFSGMVAGLAAGGNPATRPVAVVGLKAGDGSSVLCEVGLDAITDRKGNITAILAIGRLKELYGGDNKTALSETKHGFHAEIG
ncbi:MAG: response regulator [Methanoregulaceae archaeon]|nr:response regulator [Methanoregulaceae archaeon]